MSTRISDTTARSDYFDAPLRALLGEEGCPICRESIAGENDYLSYLLVETYRVRRIQEEIAAALGFCMKHGSWLKQRADKSYQIAFLSSALVGDILDRLRQHSRDETEEPDSRLTLPDPCPACALGEHVAATKISMLSKLLQEPDDAERYGNPGLLCFPHFQTFFPQLAPAPFERFLVIHQQALERAKNSLNMIAAMVTVCPPFDTPLGAAETLHAALIVAVGSEPGLTVWPDLTTPVGKPDRNPAGEFAASLGRDDICPVCREVRRAWQEWMTWLDAAKGPNEPAEDVLPSCPEHVWAAARLGSPRCAVATAQNVVVLSLRQIYFARTLMSEAPASARRIGERLRSRFQGSRHRLTKAREAAARPIPCPVCRRMDTARDRCLELLFALLQESRYRAAFENGYGLCLKHFSRALALQPPPLAQRILVECASAKLARLAREMEDALRKWTWPARAETRGAEQNAWRRAVSRLSGSFEAGEQWVPY